jgi:polygalacturonase
MCGPLVLSNSINLQINSNATLKMLPRFANASVTNWPTPTLPPFISGNGVHDVAITGLGTIDGNADFGSTNWWGANLDEKHRPHMVDIGGSSTRILIQGVTLQNTPVFHLVLKGSNIGVTIQNITEIAPGNSPNTDGIDLASTNVLIQNCSIIRPPISSSRIAH